MGKSRHELTSWLSELLDLNVSRVEECGRGAIPCQIMDSIYRDVPMSRVRFEARNDYEKLSNFKILTNCMEKHRIEYQPAVTSLINCKMQDNLEFLQWLNSFWMENFSGEPYDAVARRSKGGSRAAGGASLSAPSAPASSAARRGTTPTSSTSRVASRASGSTTTAAAAAAKATAALQEEVNQHKDAIAGLEKERDFYFAKLRDIELLLQQAIEQDPELEKEEDSLVKHIQSILYSTEEGFEIPDGEEEAVPVDELETF